MSQWEIKKIKLSELEFFFHNHTFQTESIVPISPLRIVSYCKNPRADTDDTVLYYIESNDKIIAFRTVWADTVQNNGKTIKFGWCSGNWVLPEFRRQGLSLLLLNEMVADWGGKLMFTNYAPESQAGYLKTKLFPFVHERNGRRFYLNANLNELFALRINNQLKKQFIALLNRVYRMAYILKRLFFVKHSLKQYQIDESNTFSGTYSFVNSTSLFNRQSTEFQWIFNHPWIDNEQRNNMNYPFSWKTQNFNFQFVSIQKGSDLCSFVVSNRDGVVKLLYWHATDENYLPIAKWLVNFCHEKKIKTLTIIDNKMAETVRKVSNPFAISKEFSMNIYSTFPFNTENNKVFDGDGDYIFT